VAVAYLLEASRPSEACRSDRAELGGSRVVAEVRAVTHVPVEAPGETHAAEEAPRAGPAEADCCAAGFQAAQLGADSAAELPGARLADEQAAPAWSAEFRGRDCSAAAPVVPADGCSLDACPDTAGVVAPGEQPRADGEHCDCWAQERCEFPEEQSGYQGHWAEEHCH